MESDVESQAAAEARREITRDLLELFAQKATGGEYFDAVVEVIRARTGCPCSN